MIALNDSTFSLAVDKADICVVDFMADWCQPCVGVGAMLERIARRYKSTLFYKVNVDTAPRVANLYGIQSVPTVIFFTHGQPIQVLIGGKVRIEDCLRILTALGAK